MVTNTDLFMFLLYKLVLSQPDSCTCFVRCVYLVSGRICYVNEILVYAYKFKCWCRFKHPGTEICLITGYLVTGLNEIGWYYVLLGLIPWRVEMLNFRSDRHHIVPLTQVC